MKPANRSGTKLVLLGLYHLCTTFLVHDKASSLTVLTVKDNDILDEVTGGGLVATWCHGDDVNGADMDFT